MNINLNINVKFRIFGVTLGRIVQTISVQFDPITKSISFGTNQLPVPSGATVLFDDRGVLLSAWL